MIRVKLKISIFALIDSISLINQRTMTIQQLEYILAVDQFRHFAKAAEYCRVTQPTLSAMIQKLEDELGVKLFDRSMTPVCPTAIGKKVLEQARKILSEVICVKEIISEEQHSLSGTFRLAVLPTIAPYLLPRFFPQLMEKYPDLDIRGMEMKTPDIRKALLERLWLLDEGHCFRDQLVRFCQMEAVKISQMAYRLGSMETFMHMVESGKGITFIPELAVMQLSEEQKELVRPFAIPRPTRQIVLVTRKDFIRTSLLQVLKEEIQAAVPKEMLTLQAVQCLV